MAASQDKIRRLINQYIQRLSENNIPVQKVLLFGSYSKGNPGGDSDIDIAVVSSAFMGDRFSDRRHIVPLRRGIDSRIDPIPITPEDFFRGGVFIDEIKKTGQVVYSADQQE